MVRKQRSHGPVSTNVPRTSGESHCREIALGVKVDRVHNGVLRICGRHVTSSLGKYRPRTRAFGTPRPGRRDPDWPNVRCVSACVGFRLRQFANRVRRAASHSCMSLVATSPARALWNPPASLLPRVERAHSAVVSAPTARWYTVAHVSGRPRRSLPSTRCRTPSPPRLQRCTGAAWTHSVRARTPRESSSCTVSTRTL